MCLPEKCSLQKKISALNKKKKKWQAAKCGSVECSLADIEAEYHIKVTLKEWVAPSVCTHKIKA